MRGHEKIRTHALPSQARVVKDVLADVPHASEEVLLALGSVGALIDGEVIVVAEPADQPAGQLVAHVVQVVVDPEVLFANVEFFVAV